MEIKKIEYFPGYFVEDTGSIYSSLGKGCRTGACEIPLVMFELSPRITPNGYERVYMRDKRDNKRKDRYVHRLVAEAFIPNPENKSM